ncbi:hypothetical protein ACTXT7_004634 [Hymenolepis weldensis]
MDKTEESLDSEINTSENLQIQSNDSDKGSFKQSCKESPMKQSSSKCNETPVPNSHENKEKDNDPNKTPHTVKRSPKSETELAVPVGKQEENASDSKGDESRGIRSVSVDSKAEKVDSTSKGNHDELHKDNPNVQAEGDLAYSDEEEEEMFSEKEEEGEEEYLEDEDEDVPIRNRRRYFGDSDEEEEEVEEKESHHDGASQTGNEGEQDQAQVKGDIADKKKKTKEDEVAAKPRRANCRDPTYVPREGAFFMHDVRDASDNEKNGGRHQSSIPKPPRSRPDITAPWSHDLYDKRAQQPLSTDEIISRYGCNIREGDIDQINCVGISPLSVQRRSNKPRGHGRGRFSRRSQNPLSKPKSVAFAEKDSPSLRDAEESNGERGSQDPHHQRRGSFTFSRSGNSHPRRLDFRNNNPSGCEETQSKQVEPQRRQIRVSNHQRDEGAHSDPQKRPKGRRNFHRGNSRRNLDPRPRMDVLIYNSGSKRYSSNRPQNNGNTQSQQQPTRQVVIRGQPEQSQRPQNSKSYNNNRSAQRNKQNRNRLNSNDGQVKASTASVSGTEKPQVSVGPAGDSAPQDDK